MVMASGERDWGSLVKRGLRPFPNSVGCITPPAASIQAQILYVISDIYDQVRNLALHIRKKPYEASGDSQPIAVWVARGIFTHGFCLIYCGLTAINFRDLVSVLRPTLSTKDAPPSVVPYQEGGSLSTIT